ncbi:MAG: hypothetical protein JXB19_09265 [Bacteroidales bacterium]|nr:hypothetical protein [Bacteroidales bacterium]
MRKIILLILLVVHAGVFAQNIRRGFRLLENKDYERAMTIFREAVSSDESIPAASFGLAVIFADEESPYYDLVVSWDYVMMLESTINDLTQDEIDFIGEYFINTEVRRTNRPVKTKIEYAIAAIEAKLIKYIREENNLELVYKVIEKFPDFRHYDNVIHIRNQLEFRKYERQHSIEGYLRFMEEFPDAAQTGKAQKYISMLSFEKARADHSVESYRQFIREYPESPEYNTAVRDLNALAFQKAKEINTMQAMEDFITEYPDALEVAEAKQMQKQLLYDYAKKIQTLEAYNEFIRKYPEGQQYIDIFNLKSLDLGMQFATRNPIPSNNIQWMRSFEKEGDQGFAACMITSKENDYIIGGTMVTSGPGRSDIWLIKTNSEGRMLWNKSIGENENQDLRLLTANEAGEIIGFGYTWIETDTNRYNPRIFKMSSDGQKLWSKMLEKIHPKSILAMKSGDIILGGYEVTDSAGRAGYSILVLNPAGKKLWERNYSVTGEIHGLYELADGRILIAGANWSAEIDSKGYIKWESPVDLNTTISDAAVLQSGDIFYTGVRNDRQFVIKTDANNNIRLQKEYEISGKLNDIKNLIAGPGNLVAGICHYDSYCAIQWINTVTGAIEKTVNLPVAYKISEMLVDNQENLLLVVADGQILLIKNFGFTF